VQQVCAGKAARGRFVQDHPRRGGIDFAATARFFRPLREPAYVATDSDFGSGSRRAMLRKRIAVAGSMSLIDVAFIATAPSGKPSSAAKLHLVARPSCEHSGIVTLRFAVANGR